MVSELSSSKLYSHPNKLLEDHLLNVARISTHNLIASPVKNIYNYDKSILHQLVKTCGLCHDIGKSTDYFQKYLFADEKDKKKFKAMPETQHGLLSAVVAFYAAKTEFVENEDLQSEEKAFLSFAAFWIVRKHHGNLEDIINEAAISDSDRAVLEKQIKSIDETRLSILTDKLKLAGLKQSLTKSIMLEWVNLIGDELKKLRRRFRKLEREKSISPYLLINYIFSLLIDADKSEVVLHDVPKRKPLILKHNLVDEYKEKLSFEKSNLNNLREEAYREVLSQDLNLDERVYSINLPTGLGKTFTSFAFALKAREEIRDKKGYAPRIIYSLPFLSIIEQNAKEIENILRAGGFKVTTDLLLKHHHLSEIYYKQEENEFEKDEAKILIEGWNSEIIVTTFVQLFHTLLSNKNRSLRKFHRLSGSIIILDEVQSIPFKYWLVVKETLKQLMEELDSYVVFVTATEPLIFDRKEVVSLVQREKYFSVLNRVIIKPQCQTALTIEEFAQNINFEPDKNYLFILNTINSAKALYELLKTKIKEEEMIFLSTHIVPKERLDRIELMKSKKVKAAVTTQLVEAGVDIDFDVVYRDFAPLDSINQSAGRCNRNDTEQGEVIVVRLKDDRRQYSSYIYDNVLLDITGKILEKNDCIKEMDFLNIVNSYYKTMQERMASDKSRDLLNALYKMKYDSCDGTPSVMDFRLIEETYPKIDTFIEIDNDARQIWKEYLKIKEIVNLFERRLEFNQIKADFYKYVISVPATVDNIPPEVAGFRYVNFESLDNYYDSETGFRCEGVAPIW